MKEMRCKKCGKLLAKETLKKGTVEIMCPNSKCKTVTRLEK